MELLTLGKPIKKPPRSDEGDGELFCGTGTINITANGTYDVTEYDTAVVNADVKHTVSIRTKISTNNQIYYGILVDGVEKRAVWYPYDSLTHNNYTVVSLTGV